MDVTLFITNLGIRSPDKIIVTALNFGIEVAFMENNLELLGAAAESPLTQLPADSFFSC